ncbi:hypothetical protein [Burkholderia multivorans]|uniref:hypothetical protein n=1 Tax=Burkholderia multivorans TaxID=87883 RepID=UPI0021BEB3BF|nr:hypothetical protein [Burkholderia multivorans]HEM7850692.1 hypothetical protein [Burkholderia multivorans]
MKRFDAAGGSAAAPFRPRMIDAGRRCRLDTRFSPESRRFVESYQAFRDRYLVFECLH